MKIFNRMAGLSVIWYLVALSVPVIWLGLTEDYGVLRYILAVMIPVGGYSFLISLSKNPLKMWFWMLPATILSAFQLVLLNLYGYGVIAVDMFLNVATTNVTEVEELLSGLVPALIQVILLYIAPVVLAFIAVHRSEQLSSVLQSRMRRFAAVILSAGMILSVISVFSQDKFNPVRDIFPVSALDNFMTAVNRWQQTRYYEDTSRGYVFSSVSGNPEELKETYVVVIGESSRAMNWQLAGYNRPTNPHLSERGDLFFFGRTLSESNTTHKSVPLLMSALTSNNFNDSIFRVKSFLEAFNEAGFHTAFISAQQPAGSYIDLFASEANNHIFVEGAHDGTRTDLCLLDYLDRELARRGDKKFIVLHCYGSHYNYKDRYPEMMAKFSPDGPLESSPAYRERLINAYDNSVLLTDSLLSGIIDRLICQPGIAAMVYTSDHGENIFDDGRKLFLHSSPKTSFYQQHVPLLIWLSESYVTMKPSVAVALKRNEDKNVSSSSSFFHTVVDLGGLHTHVFKKELSLGADDYRAPVPVYIDDHNKALPIKEALDDPIDMMLLKKLGY